MTAAMRVRTIYRYRSVSVILRLWGLVRVGSFQMNLRMYQWSGIIAFIVACPVILHGIAVLIKYIRHFYAMSLHLLRHIGQFLL